MAGPEFFQTRMGQMFFEGTIPKIIRSLERIANALEKKDAAPDGDGPYFNHTRADGPFEPCPLCLEKMSREQLLALAKDKPAKSELKNLLNRAAAALETPGDLSRNDFGALLEDLHLAAEEIE